MESTTEPAHRGATITRPMPNKKPPQSTIPPGRNAWDRLPTETDVAFYAFKTYRDLGADRSLNRVASELIDQGRVRGNMGTVRGNLSIWSGRHRWVERAASWDRHLDRLDQIAQQRARREMRERQANMAQTMQAALSVPAQAMVTKFNRDRRLVEDLSREDVAHLIELMSKAGRVLPGIVNIERAARGEDVDLDVVYEQELSTEDRVAEEERLRRVAAIMHRYELLPAADEPDVIVVEPPEEAQG